VAPDLFWISLDSPGRLAISARPRGGDWLPDEVVGWKRTGVRLVVSLLTPEEEAEFDLTAEAAECASQGVRFVSLPVPDRSLPPDPDRWNAAVADLVSALATGIRVAAHCRQGIGRSGLLVLAVLKTLGLATDKAIRRVSAARGRPVPETPEQAGWIASYTPAQG
jgi:protein-tyrosine phosphatase